MKRQKFFKTAAMTTVLVMGINLLAGVPIWASEIQDILLEEITDEEIHIEKDFDEDLDSAEESELDEDLNEILELDGYPDDKFQNDDVEATPEEELEADVETEEILHRMLISESRAEGEIRVNSEQGLAEAIADAEEGISLILTLTQDIDITQAIEISKNFDLVLKSENGEIVITQKTHEEPHFILNGISGAMYFEDIILDGNGQGGGITVENNSRLSLYDIHIKNSLAEQGGAIRAYDSQLVLWGGVIEDNEAEQGGGIIAVNSQLYLENSILVKNNRAYSNDIENEAVGGGIAVTDNAHLVIEDAVIQGNEAYAQSNKIEALGGGVYIGVDSKGEMENTVISENNAETASQISANYGMGGGIAVSPTAVLEFKANVMIGGSSEEQGNRAQLGGGIYYEPENTETIYLDHGVKIYNNKAVFDGMPGGVDKGNGGGVLVGAKNTVIMDDAEIMYNYSAYQGGGMDLSNNTEITMKRGKINNNTAYYSGGGIKLQEDSVFTMEDGFVSYNETKVGLGGGIYGYMVGTSAGFVKDSHILLKGGEVSYNKTPASSAGVYGKYVTVDGGSIHHNYVERGLAAAVHAYTFEIISGSVSYNEVKANGTNGSGVILCYNFIMSGGEISNNVYNYSGDRLGGSTVWVEGGKSRYSSSVEITGGTIKDNKSTVGGAVAHNYYIEPEEGTRKTIISGGEFIGNEATSVGGALCVIGMPLEIGGDAVFKGNSAARGGAVYVKDLNAVTVGSDVVFENNTAETGWWLTDEETIEIHLNNISTDKFSSDFQYGFNNYDIVYTGGKSIGPWAVQYRLNDGADGIYHEEEILTMYFLEAPKPPQREGYDFTGWYKESSTEEKWIFSSDRVFEDIVLYAGWIENNSGDAGSGNGNSGNEVGGNGGNENNSGDGGDREEDQSHMGRISRSVIEEQQAIKKSVLIQEHRRYVQGYPDNTFRSENSITRAEMAVIFYNLIEDEDKNENYLSGYHDIEEDAWYYKAVAYLEAHGIVQGYPDGTFRPNTEITRGELAAFASTFFDMESGSHSFTDIPENHWAEDYITNAYLKGWIQGYPDSTFHPDGKITRGEAVTMMNAILGRKHQIVNVPIGFVKYDDLEKSHWAYAEIIEASYTHEYERKGMEL